MRFYLVNDGRSGSSWHAPTLAEAHVDAKRRVKDVGVDWRDVYVDEVEIELSKENVQRLLNEEGGTHQYLRQWGLTPRLGMKEQEREESCTEATSAT